MKSEKIILLLGGLACIAGFFLPFLSIAGQSVSGYGETMILLDYLDVVEYKHNEWIINLFTKNFDKLGGPEAYGITAMLAVVFLGPFMFAIYGLSYVLKALARKQYKRGIFINLLYMGVAFLTFFLIQEKSSVSILGLDIGAKMNFFKMAGMGYWVSFSGMMVAAFSLFFGKTD